MVSNVIENGVPIGSLGAGEAVWHTDMSYQDVPPKASILYALEVPPKEAIPASVRCTTPGSGCRRSLRPQLRGAR